MPEHDPYLGWAFAGQTPPPFGNMHFAVVFALIGGFMVGVSDTEVQTAATHVERSMPHIQRLDLVRPNTYRVDLLGEQLAVQTTHDGLGGRHAPCAA